MTWSEDMRSDLDMTGMTFEKSHNLLIHPISAVSVSKESVSHCITHVGGFFDDLPCEIR